MAADYKIFRGGSRRPLYVNSVGIDLEEAKQKIIAMHGDFRVPTLLKLADRESRKGGGKSSASIGFIWPG